MLYELLFGNKKKESNQFGDAKFMNWTRKRHYFSRNTKNGYCVDGTNFLKEKHLFNHTIYCAPTGSGKSTTIINHLLSTSKKDHYSMFVLDVSGELESICGKHLRDSGFKISRLDISNPSEGLQYNPLKRAKDSQNNNAIQQLAELLICQHDKSEKSFWEQSAISETETCLKALFSEKEEPNLLDLYNLINLITVKPKEAIAYMEKNLPEESFMDFAAFMGMEPKLRSNIIASMKAPLSQIKSKALQQLTEKDTVDLESLRTEKRVFFLRLTEGDEKYNRFLLSIFNTQLISVAMRMPQNKDEKYLPIYMFLDEFPTYRIAQFPQMVSVLRKRKVALFIYVQELSQLDEIYRINGTKTILGNMLNKFFFGNLRREQAEYVSKLLGTKTEEVNGSLRPMPLMRPEEIIGLKKFHCLYINGLDSCLLKIKPWFKSSLKKKANSN